MHIQICEIWNTCIPKSSHLAHHVKHSKKEEEKRELYGLFCCRQMEYAVSCLTSASSLAKDIAVGRRPVNDSKSLLRCFPIHMSGTWIDEMVHVHVVGQ